MFVIYSVFDLPDVELTSFAVSASTLNSTEVQFVYLSVLESADRATYCLGHHGRTSLCFVYRC